MDINTLKFLGSLGMDYQLDVPVQMIQTRNGSSLIRGENQLTIDKDSATCAVLLAKWALESPKQFAEFLSK